MEKEKTIRQIPESSANSKANETNTATADQETKALEDVKDEDIC